jgi:uncharacterized protein (DUF2147 family)
LDRRQVEVKKLFILLILFISLASQLMAGEVRGFWQTLDKKTKLPTSIIAIYPYRGKYYGRIVATYNKAGAIEETLSHPESRAPGIVGNPYYCGLDIIWGCAPEGKGRYKGYVVDPREGAKYRAIIWNEKGNLILRGELLMFGRNETLIPFPAKQFDKNFVQPNLANFVPGPYRLKS